MLLFILFYFFFYLQITYHQQSDVSVTKLGEGPNSLSFPEEGIPTTRIKCFPLYSILLAYNQTSLDYLSLDTDLFEGEVNLIFILKKKNNINCSE